MTLTRHNYEEYFLLYVDDELESEDRQSVEAFTKANPDLGDELQRLQRAVLSPEEDIFSFDKALLFKQEPSDKAVLIPIWKWGLAAASILLVASASFLALRTYKNQGSLDAKAAANNTAGSARQKEATVLQKPDQTVAVAPANAGTASARSASAGSASARSANPASVNPGVTNHSVTTQGENAKAPGATAGPISPESATPVLAVDHIIQRTQSSGEIASGFTPIAAAPLSPDSRSVANTGSEEKNPASVTSAAPVAYHTIEDTDGKNEEDKILFVRTDQVVGGDVKGFFRKAGRVLKHSTSLNTENVHSDPSADPK